MRADQERSLRVKQADGETKKLCAFRRGLILQSQIFAARTLQF